MDDVDFRKCSTQYADMNSMAGACGKNLKSVHEPVWDADINEYATNVWQASLQLNRLVNEQDEKVFIHCGAGISRSSTLLVAFLALFGVDGRKEGDQSLFSPDAIFMKDIPKHIK